MISRRLEQADERDLRIDAACTGPGDELRDIDAAIRGLAVVDPALGLAQSLTQGSLGEAGPFPLLAQVGRDDLIWQGVLRLGRHVRRA